MRSTASYFGGARRILGTRGAPLSALALVGVGLGGWVLGAASAAPPARSFEVALVQDAAQPAAVLERMRRAAAVRREHRVFREMQGSWSGTLHHAAPDGGEAPEATACEAVFETLLGGRATMMRLTGAFDFAGQTVPFEGVGLLGYDTTTGEYVSWWMDDLSLAPLLERGLPEAGDIAVEGTNKTLQGEAKMRHVYRLRPDGGITIEFFEAAADTGEMVKTAWIDFEKG